MADEINWKEELEEAVSYILKNGEPTSIADVRTHIEERSGAELAFIANVISPQNLTEKFPVIQSRSFVEDGEKLVFLGTKRSLDAKEKGRDEEEPEEDETEEDED